MKKKMLCIFVCTLMMVASATLIGTTAADWNPGDGHKMHFPQLPDENGWDVSTTYLREEQWGIVLADDWKCSESGPVTDIYFWGSWKGGNEGTIKSFWIAIHEDIPKGPNVLYSRPGRTLWEREFTTWKAVPKKSPTYQGWYCAETGEYIENDHKDYFQYNIENIQDPFYQTSGKIYWLAITAEVERVPGGVQPLWGWKSSEKHWNDDACWSYWGELDWTDIYEPGGGLEPITNEFWAQVNPNGYLEEGSGTDAYGNRWYYYENTGWWNVWFYDHPFDPDRYKDITIEFDFNPSPTGGGWATIALNWATPYWEPGSPPPIPPLTPEEEQEYVARYVLLEEVVQPGHYAFEYTISDYNPEWVSVDIMGMNFDIMGRITHECLPSEPTQSLDLAFVITGEELTPKIGCEGTLSWSGVTPGSTVTGTIYVKNIGDAGSELKWSVCGYPTTWGTWTFIPSSGTGLKPGDGKKPITVAVVAPNQKNQQFTGQITLCNDEDASDTCTIQVSLATPRNKIIITPLIKFLENYLYLFHLFQRLLIFGLW